MKVLSEYKTKWFAWMHICANVVLWTKYHLVSYQFSIYVVTVALVVRMSSVSVAV